MSNKLDELERLSKAAIKHSKQYSFEDSDDQIDLANMIMDLGIAVNQLIKVARAASDVVSGDVEHWRDVIGALAQLERGE